MAQLLTVRLVDDLTGEEAAETVAFALDGKSFEIDLSIDHAARLRDDLAPFVGAARRASSAGAETRTSRGGPPKLDGAASSRQRNQGVRAWARQNGFKISDRGRIPAEILIAYRSSSSTAESPGPDQTHRDKPAERAPASHHLQFSG
ncbi:Lsr2 family protein [Pseudonocardia nematodicida]|uniref:Lsr2 family protein n=1 Tax=Pseudonocardia nematodicida TaxID=1206997 RepID=A0ABV1KEE9_9PSEU